MAVQRHPVDSFDPKLNFWEEFSDYKIHPTFSRIWKNNSSDVDQIKSSSSFMWLLAMCYDRKSSIYNQPEQDKWEVASEALFNDPKAMLNFVLYDDKNKPDPFSGDNLPIINIPINLELRTIITEFEKSIDTPLGLSLRELERKLVERTNFIMNTPYTIDGYTEPTEEQPKSFLIKGTADQLDKMFANTEKINALITKSIENLRAASGQGVTKGGQMESLGDKAKDF